LFFNTTTKLPTKDATKLIIIFIKKAEENPDFVTAADNTAIKRYTQAPANKPLSNNPDADFFAVTSPAIKLAANNVKCVKYLAVDPLNDNADIINAETIKDITVTVIPTKTPINTDFIRLLELLSPNILFIKNTAS
jgi:hypothetical protein